MKPSRTRSEREKLERSVKDLEHAMEFTKEVGKDTFYSAGITKSFEVSMEHAWKYFKAMLAEEGLEADSPKEAIKLAGRAGWIENVEAWLDYLEDRNLAAHDYLGVSNPDYMETIRSYLNAVKKLHSS
jgi:nucleotidyltransferase substrate binding protein (TIGR01987 family)